MYSVQNREDKTQQNDYNKSYIVDKGSHYDDSSISKYLFPTHPPLHSILVDVLRYFCDAVVKCVTSKIWNRSCVGFKFYTEVILRIQIVWHVTQNRWIHATRAAFQKTLDPQNEGSLVKFYLVTL